MRRGQNHRQPFAFTTVPAVGAGPNRRVSGRAPLANGKGGACAIGNVFQTERNVAAKRAVAGQIGRSPQRTNGTARSRRTRPRSSTGRRARRSYSNSPASVAPTTQPTRCWPYAAFAAVGAFGSAGDTVSPNTKPLNVRLSFCNSSPESDGQRNTGSGVANRVAIRRRRARGKRVLSRAQRLEERTLIDIRE